MSSWCLSHFGWLLNKKGARLETNLSLVFLHSVRGYLSTPEWSFVPDIGVFVLKTDVKLQPTCSFRILPVFCWHTEFCSYHWTLCVLAVRVVFISFILKTTIWDGYDCWKVKHALRLCLTSLIATYPTLGWAASPSTASLEKKSCLLSALNKIITIMCLFVHTSIYEACYSGRTYTYQCDM